MWRPRGCASAARCTTASCCGKAWKNDRTAAASVTSSLFTAPPEAARLAPTTVVPSAWSDAVSRRPTNPLAPVTTTLRKEPRARVGKRREFPAAVAQQPHEPAHARQRLVASHLKAHPVRQRRPGGERG